MKGPNHIPRKAERRVTPGQGHHAPPSGLPTEVQPMKQGSTLATAASSPDHDDQRPMSIARLRAIARRARSATPGPWWGGPPATVIEARHFVIIRGAPVGVLPAGEHDVPFVADVNVSNGKAREGADAAFIAHARADVPALVAEVLRLRAELRRARGEKS